MRNIGIIGSGISGLLAGLGLLQRGHKTTIYSELSAEDWLHKMPPTGTAARFASSLDVERALGVAHWDDKVPQMEGIHLTFCPKPGRQLLDMLARFSRWGTAVDVRLQSHRWTLDFVERGGTFEHTKVDLARMDEIAAEHELLIVAAGKGEIGGIFPRDELRSVYHKPQRLLSLSTVKNVAMNRYADGIPFKSPVKFNFFGSEGEAFWVPFYHKSGTLTYSLVFEAKENRALDRYRHVKDGRELLEIHKKLVKEIMPWDWHWLKDAELADDLGWLVGAFTPMVRKPVGRLPSGRIAMAIGDTVNPMDPVGGQGANNNYRFLPMLFAAVDARADRPFDAAWMEATFDEYYRRSAAYTNRFNNMLLEPLSTAGKLVLMAQYGSDGRGDNRSAAQLLANCFAENFDNPALYTDCFLQTGKAKELIRQMSGKAWWRTVLPAAARVATGQLRQTLGMKRSSHPLATMKPLAT
jgi:Styrene monooxygenase A putative substrate binding domain